MLMLLQVPCRFNGGVVVGVDRFRASMGGWVRLLFKNVNGPPLAGVQFSKVRKLEPQHLPNIANGQHCGWWPTLAAIVHKV